MSKSVARIKKGFTRRRVVAAAVTVSLALVAVFAYPYARQWISGANAGTFMEPESNPSAVLEAMTDDELRQFALNNRLPDYLQPQDWVHAEVLRQALREQSAIELVKRWERDRSGVGIGAVSPTNDPAGSQRGVLGVQLVNHGYGLTISHVYPQSAAWHAGLRKGDQILAVNHRRVVSQEDLIGQLHQAANSGGIAQLEIVRNYARHYVTANVSGQAVHVANRGVTRY